MSSSVSAASASMVAKAGNVWPPVPPPPIAMRNGARTFPLILVCDGTASPASANRRTAGGVRVEFERHTRARAGGEQALPEGAVSVYGWGIVAGVAAIVLVVDQLSKALVLTFLAPGAPHAEVVIVSGFLRLYYGAHLFGSWCTS